MDNTQGLQSERLADAIDNFLERRLVPKYDPDPLRDGLTVSLLLRVLHAVNRIIGRPHRSFVKWVVVRRTRNLERAELGLVALREIEKAYLFGIDIWTALWLLLQFFCIYPCLFLLTRAVQVNRSVGLFFVFFAFYALSLFRCTDILTTLAKLHLSPEYFPHTSPRAVVGTFAQLFDIVITFANSYLLITAVALQNPLGFNFDLTRTIALPIYFSLSTMTLNLGLPEFGANGIVVQAVNIIQFCIGLLLLIVIFQNVVSPKHVRFEAPTQHENDSKNEHIEINGSIDDAFYAKFIDRFRHDEDFVKELFQQFSEVFLGRDPVLDIGCGRGEFLETMRAANLEAYGVDASPYMIRRCREKGVNAFRADWMEHLRSVPDQHLGGIFTAQFVEHLSPDELINLVKVAYRKLRPGGRLVVETLTPSVYTLLTKFFVDFTHKAPINPDALEFLVSYVGFKCLAVKYYNNPSESERLGTLSEATEGHDFEKIFNRNMGVLNDLLFRPHYYCIIAEKPRTS